MSQVDELIREFELPGESAPTDESLAAARARRRLRDAIVDEAARRGRHPRRGRYRAVGRRSGGTGLVVPGLIAGGLAAVLLAIFALLPGGEAGDTRLGPPSASAKTVLERVASVAGRAPAGAVPSARQYLYLKWIRGWTSEVVAGRHVFAYRDRDTEQDWEAPNGSGRQRIVEWGFHFLTPADRAAWLASGTESPAEPSTDGGYPVGAYFDNCNVPPRGPAGLSTDPARLLPELVARYEGGHADLGATVGTVACMLQASGYPPLRAALYRVLERLPGVQALGWRRDLVGRRGVAIAAPERAVREVLLVDPRTANPLELEQIQTRLPRSLGAAAGRRAPSGMVIAFSVFLGRGVVDSKTALPGGGTVTFRP